MKLIPVLAHVDYNRYTGNIVKIEEFSPEETKRFCNKRGYYISEDLCNIKTYMKYASLVFRVQNPTDEELKKYPFEYKYDMHYERNTCYICFRNSYNNKQYSPVYTAGTLFVDNGEGGKITVNVIPSNMSEEDYLEIINDLTNIHSRLIEEKLYNSNMTISERWEYAVNDLKEQFLKLKSAVHEIEKNPDENLEKILTYTKSHKVKKFTPRTLNDISAGKNKVRTFASKTTLAIDEHCMIKSYLEDMKELILRYENMHYSDYMYPTRETELPAKEDYNDKIDEVKNEIYNICKNPVDETNNPREFLIYVNNKIQPPVSRMGYKGYQIKSVCFKAFYPPSCPFCLSSPHKYTMNNVTKNVTWYLKVCTDSNNLGSIEHVSIARGCFFLYCLEKAYAGSKDIKVRGGCYIIDCNKEYLDAFIYLDLVQSVYSGGNEITYCEFYDYICENPEKLINYISAFEENIYFGKYMEQNYKDSLEKREELWKNKEKMSEFYAEIDSFIKKSEILKNSSGNKRLRSTNLFSMHPSYRRAYTVMKDNISKFRILEFYKNNSIHEFNEVGIQDKLVNIYEKWCLIKILTVFTTVYGFTFSNKENNLQDIISRCLEENDNIRGSSFTLECNNPYIKVIIDYDKPLDPNYIYSHRPDFLFTISANGRTRRFCMDAKCKDYSEMNYNLEQDIQNVARDKYIDLIKNKYNIFISGSYILHCDAEYTSRNIEFAQKGDISYGAIYMTPSNENKNKELCFLIQMIMEHYFQLYSKKCWVCGSNDIEIEKKLTVSGEPKYYIHCKKCGHFLVETHCINSSDRNHRYKIGKHICNTYYKFKENLKWNVKCVECESYL